MRKSIFLTVILVLFTGVASLYAQCTENELNPAAGVPHLYEVSIKNANGYNADGVYTWYVTQSATDLLKGAMKDDSDFKATGASSVFSAYNSEKDDTKNKLELTWKTDAITNGKPYFLVLKYKEDNGTCEAMNIKVMKIEPLNQFMLTIKPVKNENGEVGNEVCAANVVGASYDEGEGKVTYIYGENTIYYQIKASGFVGKWKPQIQLPDLSSTGGQKYVSAQWKDAAGKWHDFGATQTASSQKLTSSDLAEIPASTVPGKIPEQIYIVKVVINNEKYETLSDQVLEVATDGTYGGVSNDALKDQKLDCKGDEDTFADKGSYTIKARPTVTASSGQFIQEIH